MREIQIFRYKSRPRVDQDRRSLGLIEALKERTMHVKEARLHECCNVMNLIIEIKKKLY